MNNNYYETGMINYIQAYERAPVPYDLVKKQIMYV
jgi:hypothetical protein